VFLLLTCHTIFAQNALDSMTAAFEKQMRASADDWMAQRYARALDGFLAARDIVRRYMPELKEDFEWQTASVFTSYSMLLARMVEIEMHEAEGNGRMTPSLTSQSLEWAERLQEQALTWADLHVQSLEQMQFRNRWLNRITLAIRRARNGKG